VKKKNNNKKNEEVEIKTLKFYGKLLIFPGNGGLIKTIPRDDSVRAKEESTIFTEEKICLEAKTTLRENRRRVKMRTVTHFSAEINPFEVWAPVLLKQTRVLTL